MYINFEQWTTKMLKEYLDTLDNTATKYFKNSDKKLWEINLVKHELGRRKRDGIKR